MSKILIVEDDPFFLTRLQNSLAEHELTIFKRADLFNYELTKNKDSLIAKINEANFFLLDFYLEYKADILNSKIFETICKYKQSPATIVSISNFPEADLVDIMQKRNADSKLKFDFFAGKNTENVVGILG